MQRLRFLYISLSYFYIKQFVDLLLVINLIQYIYEQSSTHLLETTIKYE